MFESAELGHKIDKETYKAEEPKLREALLNAQFDLKDKGKFPVIILISGVEGAGKGETVNLLNEWMDPRLIQTRAFFMPTDEERDKPPMWRFWKAMPPRGQIGIMFGSWYTAPVVNRVLGRSRVADLNESIEEINRLERMLCDEGALIIKFWFHLSKAKQEKRLKTLSKDPKTSWRVTEADWKTLELYDKFKKWSEHTLRETSTGDAPWIVVEGEDPYYRSLTVGKYIEKAIRQRLDVTERRTRKSNVPPIFQPIDHVQILDRLDLSVAVPKKKYEEDLEVWQGKLNALVRDKAFKKRALITVFEGNDAAGKGGSIRRLASALDARMYDIIPVAAPTEEERAQPYLWRFWRHIPAKGRMTIFDRSWYGRVLVERIEGFCSEFDWMRAYGEISDFEQQLVDSDITVAKFWLAISKEEQLRRFKEREQIGYKRFKITDEDWRNREKWDLYANAVNDMVERTSTASAPWTLVESNDKYHARIKVLKTLVKALERDM